MKFSFKVCTVALALIVNQSVAEEVNPAYLSQFKSLPSVMESNSNKLTDDKIDLGRKLFFDTRLSKNHDVSCNSCHGLDKYGVDGDQFSTGHRNQKGGRNAPTVYNAALHISQFWDGRAADVEEQAQGPVLNPIEMAMPNKGQVLKVLNSIPGYVELFEKVYGKQ
ncbi:MAG: cytochrome-c peroxidase [Lentisphaeraceae bacterium]|nr:cytochrome-c peroxidase [Lentisphaeraceae bacterium]